MLTIGLIKHVRGDHCTPFALPAARIARPPRTSFGIVAHALRHPLSPIRTANPPR
ncbi:hypothetical protein Bcep1808_1202 [Burkholderia vietnamiensis G4]|uniref:Uncharacterized protein n=1 Tax=Burkholderia vietnamiensis (strain G4 / LMG 22486) TaxID=269482 RepID=A4JD60_BURVG|nr:hypothetical protein Bcep1808_1202 [Burkholderia vietnamiensis G4]